MAQHDYVIDNQTSSQFRVDLNNALAAIVSQNSGDTEPATPFASQVWYDTLNNLLKQRNESNSAWITLGTVNEGTGKFEPNQTFATQAEAEAGTVDTVAMTPLKVYQGNTARIASQAEAEAGTNTTKLMTPQRVSQAIAALSTGTSLVNLGDIVTTSGTSQTLSGLNLTPYQFIHLVFRDISHNSGTARNIRIGPNSSTIGQTGTSASDIFVGIAKVYLGTGTYTSVGGAGASGSVNSGVSGAGYAGRCGITSATTSITISLSADSFDAGRVTIYGEA